MDGESIPDQSVAGDISLWGGGPLDPEDCIRSLAWGDGLWNDSPWSHWREEYYPRVGDSRIAWAQDFYERHWTFCQNVSNLTIRVEDVGVNIGINARPRGTSEVVLGRLGMSVNERYYQ